MVFAADEATDSLLDLEFMAVCSGPSLFCLVALAWQEGGAAPDDFVYVVLCLVLILRCHEEIPKSDLNWFYLAMALLKALFGFRRIAL